MIKKITAKFPGLRVLVADDYIINQELTKEMLEMMDCDVSVADDGAQAVTMHTENPFALIFMDIQMPELDGYEATKKIRDLEADSGAHTPIIAITANALSGDREKCITAGMDDYISKPIKGENLEQMLQNYTG